MFEPEAMRDKVEAFDRLLSATPPEVAHIRPAPDAWTLTEIVGHLVDSASNNHQRFARLRMGDLDSFPGYEAEAWVKAQGYDGFDFAALAGLWRQYNAFLLHLAATTPETAAGNAWASEGKSLTLESLVGDYYEHLSLHTEHYARRLAEVSDPLPPA
ncbi:DinB family protein [Pseudodesulfovibrio methanolicus]|uniref:DinB family protein n=1 Tax=Pseudodesulfovibrio methanolicus TaxID=3126690 RepID=A0ABZ2J1K1_9BACT